MEPVRELRLGLVLYGGVSLAVYMHGATRELQALVRGSGLSADAGADEAAGSATSEDVYRELLAAKADEEGVATRVVIDTIAGTSAGGINGVYLAKALARDLSQEALRDLWLRRADMGVLLRGPSWLPWKTRLAWAVATLWHEPLLQGGPMCAWLYDALAAMDDTEVGGAPLLPEADDLQLFVTLTDLEGYQREIAVDDPPVVAQRQHRHAMAFRHGSGRADFDADAGRNAALAFSARATSSLPGGFPAMSLGAFEQEIQRRCGVGVDLTAPALSHLLRHYELAGADPRATHFVDGGLLDNKPFGHALDAIQRKHAGVEVDRQLLYLDPDPAGAPGADQAAATAGGDQPPRAAGGDQPAAATADPDDPPSPLSTVLGALGTRGNEPILEELLALRARNERVRHLRDVIEASWPDVAGEVEHRLGTATLAASPADLDTATWQDWSDDLHQRAGQLDTGGYPSYVRVKIADAVDHWAGLVCRVLDYPSDSQHAAFVGRVLHTRARRAGLYAPDPATPTDEQIAFLRDLDLGYRERRLRFLLAALSWWYRPEADDGVIVARRRLDAVGELLSERLGRIQATMAGDGLPAELGEQVSACLGAGALAGEVHRGQAGAEAFVTGHSDALDELATALRAHLRQRVASSGAQLLGELASATAPWPEDARRRLLVRYLGFPLWDARLFPLQRISGVGEQDEVEVTRLSPRDADLLRPQCGGELAGAQHHHLGAFFSRDGRERDYLWGRLDTAERMVGLLLGRDHPKFADWCHRAFAAIVAEEDDALDQAGALLACVARHSGGAGAG